MKKLLVVLLGAAFIAGCGLIPDEEAIKKLLTEDLTVTAEPTDKGVKIYVSGMPAELPNGLSGISVFVTNDTANLGDPEKEGLTQDDSVVVQNLVNGEENSVIVRGEVGGQTTAYGFSRGFYPRPGGFGDYLGYDPDNSVDSGGIHFDRETGSPDPTLGSAADADFILYRDGENLYLAKRPGVTPGGVALASQPAAEWLDVQDAPEAAVYGDSLMIEPGKIYQFMTGDATPYYGKFAIDSVKLVSISTFMGSGDAVKVWLRYAFQTAQGVGHY